MKIVPARRGPASCKEIEANVVPEDTIVASVADVNGLIRGTASLDLPNSEKVIGIYLYAAGTA
jgi:hypothetical protein